MAVNNRLVPQTAKKSNEIAFMAGGMEVKLTPEVVRNYLVSGNKENVTMQELAMFMNLCKFSGLNPWTREAYCIKYGNEPATMVVGKDAYFKRADSEAAFDGMTSGIIVIDADGAMVYRNGSLSLPGEQIVGGWAEVYRKDRAYSFRDEVSFEEYAGRKKDGSLNSQWGKKPATMIKKVAEVHALKAAFPNNLSGMYIAEERGYAEEDTAPNVSQEAAESTQEAPKQQAVENTAPAQNTAQGQQMTLADAFDR